MYILDIEDSSLINLIEYDENNEELTVHFIKYYVDKLTYIGVPFIYFQQFAEEHSKGKFYLRMIKPNFKQKSNTMPDKPETVNPFKHPDKVFVKMSIDLTKLNRDWFFIGKDGAVYANLTLAVNPDGEVDKYGNLGMITQDVPKSVYENETKLPKDKRTRGNILGNGAVFASSVTIHTPGSETDKMGVSDEVADDLPF